MVAENLALLKWKLRMKSSAVNMVVNLKKQNRMHSIKAIMAATLGNLFIPRV